MLLQNVYVIILNNLYKKWVARIDIKTRNVLLWSIFLSISIFFILRFSGVFSSSISFTNTKQQAFASILLVLAALFSMDGPIETVKWNKTVITPFLLGGIGLIITGFLHPIGDGYQSLGFMIVIVYPCFYIVWNNRKDYESLFDKLAGSNLLVSTVYVVYCFFAFYNEFPHYIEKGLRFAGTTMNANYFSFVGMMMFCSAVYMAYRKKDSRSKIAIYIVLTIPGAIVTWLGQSRAAIAVVVLTMVVVAFFCLKNVEVNKIDQKKLISIAMIILVVVAGTVVIHKKIDVASENGNANHSVAKRFSSEGKDLNSYTSGRINLWKIYIPMINLTGNNVDEIDWDSLPVTKAAHCHNTFIEFGYRCGIFVATLFLYLKLISGVIAIWFLLNPRLKHARYMYPVMVMIIYEICSLIDVATLPMERYAPFFFYLILAIMIDPRPNAEREEKHKEMPRVIYRDTHNLYR